MTDNSTYPTAHCAYCGSIYDLTRDHLIPRSYSQNQSFRSTESNPIVIACRECNSTLGDQLFDTLPERAAHLYRVYKDKYKRLLTSNPWTEKELSEMGSAFRDGLSQRNIQRKEVSSRLQHLELILSGIAPDDIDDLLINTIALYQGGVVDVVAPAATPSPRRRGRPKSTSDDIDEETKAMFKWAEKHKRKMLNKSINRFL